MSFPTASECSTEVERDYATARLPLPSRASPPVGARAREVAGGCARSCSLCSLTPVAAPTHCTPSEGGCSYSLSLLSVSVSRPPLRLSLSSLSCLVSFHRSQPRSRRVEGSALSAQTAATPGRPRTNLPALLLLLPHGPASLHRRRYCCCRVEGDPDPTLFLRPDIKTHKKNPLHDEGRATFPLCFENPKREGRGEKERGRER